LFVHIVKKINSAIHRQEGNNKYSSNDDKCAIGVLDIFGFENFDANSFEQVKNRRKAQNRGCMVKCL
jgi:myosin heavy subunit